LPTLLKLLEADCADISSVTLRRGEAEARVSEVYLATGAPCNARSSAYRDWPGPETDVFRWYVLTDGMAIGLRGKPGEPRAVARYPLRKINHIDWNRLRTFLVVHEAGSFTKAGLQLDLTQSAVSRQIAALEHDIGGALFIRGHSGLWLTELGESFLATVQRMWETLALGLSRLNELRDTPEGPLRLTTTVGFGSAWLTSRMSAFHERNPDIQVSLILVDNAELDLRRREADCAIRFRMPDEDALVQRRIGDYSYHIYGCRRYLEQRGVPETLDDLEQHDLIVYGEGVGEPPVEDINWILSAGLPEGQFRNPTLIVNSVYGMYRAVESGLGLAALPFYMSERSDKLVEVLSHVESPPIPVYFVYPEELRPSRRIEAMREFLVEEIRARFRGLRDAPDTCPHCALGMCSQHVSAGE